MAEELGKIEKPPVASFKKGRKLYFVPLIYSSKDLPEDFLVKFHKYWEQVEKQVAELSTKLGEVNRIYHELVATSGEDAMKTIEELSEKSHKIVRTCLEKKAQLEAVEDSDILTEFMDWSRCLIIGLQNPKVVSKIYDFYIEAGKKRNEYIACKIDETLQENEIGLLLMRENHQVQFPPDIQVFYVAPPALDELKRWLRENEGKSDRETGVQNDKK
jgi:sugar-specific transcriptional regulator TrmB